MRIHLKKEVRRITKVIQNFAAFEIEQKIFFQYFELRKIVQLAGKCITAAKKNTKIVSIAATCRTNFPTFQ